MKELLTHIATGITGEKEITVEEQEDNGIIQFTLQIPKEKVGIIIGKEGRTINAMKNILKIIALRENKRVGIEIEEK